MGLEACLDCCVKLKKSKKCLEEEKVCDPKENLALLKQKLNNSEKEATEKINFVQTCDEHKTFHSLDECLKEIEEIHKLLVKLNASTTDVRNAQKNVFRAESELEGFNAVERFAKANNFSMICDSLAKAQGNLLPVLTNAIHQARQYAMARHIINNNNNSTTTVAARGYGVVSTKNKSQDVRKWEPFESYHYPSRAISVPCETYTSSPIFMPITPGHIGDPRFFHPGYFHPRYSYPPIFQARCSFNPSPGFYCKR